MGSQSDKVSEVKPPFKVTKKIIPVLLLDFSDLFGPVEVVVVALVEAVEAAGGASKREFEMQFVVFSELLALFFLLDFDELFKSVSLSR